MAGRPRKPLSVLELSGSTKVNPGRYKDRQEVKSGKGIGAYPGTYPTPEAAWEYLCSVAPPGLLDGMHAPFLKQVAELMARIDSGREGPKDRSQLLAGLARLGMTPTDASKVKLPPKKPDAVSRWAQYVR